MVALVCFPSVVAVIPVMPGETPVTSPEPEAVAMVVSELDQLMARPVTTLPLASFVTAVS
jgi:hypothetical protein